MRFLLFFYFLKNRILFIFFMKKILILNGPNINLIGNRQSIIYGLNNINNINYFLVKKYNNKNFKIDIIQNNSESFIINFLQKNIKFYNGIIINLAAFSYSSYCLRDFFLTLKIPIVEVHISNISKRKERFRTKSLISNISTGTLYGFGEYSYHLAIEWFLLNFNIKKYY